MSDIELLQGNAFDALKALPRDYGHVAILDYPWTMKNTKRAGKRQTTHPEDWDFVPNERITEVLQPLADSVVNGGWVFVFADDTVYPQFRDAVDEVDALTFRKTLQWNTERLGMGLYYRTSHLPIIAATVGDTKRYVRSTGTVFKAPAIARQPGRADTYPSEKPAELYRQILEPVTNPDERVLEPFCGSAPGLSAAKSLNLDYWGMDIADAAIRRAKQRDGQTRLGETNAE